MWESKVPNNPKEVVNFKNWIAAMGRMYPKYADDILSLIRQSQVLSVIIDRSNLNSPTIAPRRSCCGR
jgi:hypothetical protein